MGIKEVNTKVEFLESITKQEAISYIEDTLNDASKISISITWGFDEAQADAFHRSWTGDKFLQCIEKIV